MVETFNQELTSIINKRFQVFTVNKPNDVTNGVIYL